MYNLNTHSSSTEYPKEIRYAGKTISFDTWSAWKRFTDRFMTLGNSSFSGANWCKVMEFLQSPLGYNLPLEYTKLAAECSRTDRGERVWICKPVGQSQGKGIFLFRVRLHQIWIKSLDAQTFNINFQKLSDLIYDNVAVVQRYIENPLLIGGYKFDLRLYVCVPSYQPLAIYIYKEGLVRFATQKFSLDHLDDPFRHLTNCSLNKMGPGYSEKKERIGAGENSSEPAICRVA